jgi:hypothetical protein
MAADFIFCEDGKVRSILDWIVEENKGGALT